jgi:urease accessory protein
VQKSLYPEGGAVCQNVIVHPPGGIVGGDTLAVNVDAGPGVHAQLTTPGAAKCYRSSGAFARQRIGLRAARGAVLEWIPQETRHRRASVGTWTATTCARIWRCNS